MINIFFVWPFKGKITSDTTESYEFYIHLKKMNNVKLVSNFDEADFIFYMMDIKTFCLNKQKKKFIDMNNLQKLLNNKNYEKEVYIDYNDYTSLKNVPNNILPNIKYFFKRSIVDKKNLTLINYPKKIIPISYGIRTDFIKYDSEYKFIKYKYDICYLFYNYKSGNRKLMQNVVEKYNGPKYIGYSKNCNNRYSYINKHYYDILKNSKIIVTANPSYWEGDFRLWEALLMGNLVLCDEMVVPHILKYPLINKKHIVFYKNGKDLYKLIHYYINNEEERKKIGIEGRNYCLKYHKFSDRVEEVINTISKK